VLKAKEEIQRFDVTWSEGCSSFGLAGMSLDDMAEWLRKRDATLTAWEAREDAQKSLDSTVEAVTESTRALVDSLRESGIADVVSESLAALCALADGFISSVDGAAARRDTLTTQLNAAQAILAPLKLAVTEATEDLDRWKADWTDTLTSAGLPPTSDVGTAEGALELIGLVEEKLRKSESPRS
jgi:phytoene dehydrogenase-like protein